MITLMCCHIILHFYASQLPLMEGKCFEGQIVVSKVMTGSKHKNLVRFDVMRPLKTFFIGWMMEAMALGLPRYIAESTEVLATFNLVNAMLLCVFPAA